MANKITYVNKVENNGSTQDGLLFAFNLNEIKEVVNTNRDDFVDKNPTQGQISGTNLLIKNTAGSTLFSVDLSSFSGGGSGYVHPEPSRVDTTDTAQNLSNGGSFTVINQVSSNLQGHITGVRTKRLTLPSQTTIPTSAALDSNTLKFYNASTLLFSADLSSLGGRIETAEEKINLLLEEPEEIQQFPSYLNFPNLGKPNVLYIDTEENESYRWDNETLKYYKINDIEIINGGN